MKSIFLKKMKDEKGQNLVEFALIAGLLLAIFLGIVEFGRAWYYADLLKGAANKAARTRAVGGTDQAAKDAAESVINGHITGWNKSADVSSFCNSTSCRATVKCSFKSVVPFMPAIGGSTISILGNITTIRRDATYRNEQ